MSQTGQITVRTYMSQMTIPVSNANVIIYTENERKQTHLIAVRTTDRNGETTPVIIQTPDEIESLSPPEENGEKPFVNVNIFAEAENFQSVLIHNAQVFANNTTLQNIEFVPLAEPQIRESDVTDNVFITDPPISQTDAESGQSEERGDYNA